MPTSKNTPSKKKAQRQPTTPRNRTGTQRSVSSQKSSAAVAYANATRTVNPSVTGSYGSHRIKHRELIATVTGQTAFTTTSYPINPGSQVTFPWLSTQAQSWEMYRFHKLKFEYVGRTSTSTIGVVLLAVDYDSTDTAPQSEQVACSYLGTVSDSPWVPNFSHTLIPSRMHPNGPKYVRFGVTAPTDQDLKTLDAGNMYLCTTDFASATACGKLWVEYDVEFLVPHLPPSGSLMQNSARIQSLTSSTTTIFGPPNTGKTDGNFAYVVSGNTIVFNTLGEYLVTYYAVGTGMFNGGAVLMTGTANTVSSDIQISNVGATISVVQNRVKITAIGQTLNYGAGVHTSVSKVCVTVSDYKYDNGSLVV